MGHHCQQKLAVCPDTDKLLAFASVSPDGFRQGDALLVAPPFGRRTEQTLEIAVLFARGDGRPRLSASTRPCHPADFLVGIGLSFPIDSGGDSSCGWKAAVPELRSWGGRNRGIQPRHARPGKAGLRRNLLRLREIIL